MTLPAPHTDAGGRYRSISTARQSDGQTDGRTDAVLLDRPTSRSGQRQQLKRSNWFEARPHRRRVHIVQLYSSGGADVHPRHLTRMVPWVHTTPLPELHLHADRFNRFTLSPTHRQTDTYTQTTAHVTSAGISNNYAMHAMRPKTKKVWTPSCSPCLGQLSLASPGAAKSSTSFSWG